MSVACADGGSLDKINIRDKFVFKLSGEVFTVKEVRDYYESAYNLNCIFNGSLLYRVFFKDKIKRETDFFTINKNYSQVQKEFFSELLPFGKSLVYIRSYTIKIKPSIIKYFQLKAKKNNCNTSVFKKDQTLSRKFREILELEIFLRTRFLPTEIEGQISSDDLNKAVLSARNLLKSINEQLDQEIYW